MFLLAALLALPAQASSMVIEVTGLDDCCAVKAVDALQKVPGVRGIATDVAGGRLCIGLGTTPPGDDAVRTAVTEAGFGVGTITSEETCPEGMTLAPTDPWAGAHGLDFAEISQGETFDLDAHAPDGKVTIFDFGARWCGPCWDVADALTAGLAARPWLAVRATNLAGSDAVESFATPAAQQHLANAAGIPWLLVRNPKGRIVYRGSDPEKALAAADKHAP